MVKIKYTKTGNCPCINCGRVQEGIKLQPLTVWFKREDEKRGHNAPVCSVACAKQLASELEELQKID